MAGRFPADAELDQDWRREGPSVDRAGHQPQHDLVLAHDIPEEPPSAASSGMCWSRRCSTQRRANRTGPPSCRCVPMSAGNRCRPHIEEIGVSLVVTDELDQVDGVFEDMTEHAAANRSRACWTCRG